MKQLLNSLDTLTRRNFVERCAATAFGLSVLRAAPLAAADSTTQKQDAFGKAKRVIWLMLSGGLSHIDSFDPKEGKSKGPSEERFAHQLISKSLISFQNLQRWQTASA